MRTPRHALLLSCALLASACGSGTRETGQEAAGAKATAPTGSDTSNATAEKTVVVATYAGKQLTGAAVLEEMERLPGPSRSYLSAPDRKRQFVENLILNELLFSEAQKSGFDKDPEIEKQVDDMRKRLVVQRLMREYQKPPTITDEEAKKYYDDNPNLYSSTQIKASHILLKDEEAAKKLRADLAANPAKLTEKFAERAKELSIDKTSGAKGGDLGKFGQGRMVPEFERAAFGLKAGQLSEPIKTQYGWHIILVGEREEGERKPFDQVKEQIKTTLRNKQLQDNVQAKFESLKKSANVEIDETVLVGITPPPAAPGQPGMSPHGGGH